MSEKTEQSENTDINKAFENLLFTEELAESAGYKEGYSAGKTQFLNGYHLGYHQASLLAAQLGYYHGILEQYLQTNRNDSEKITSLAENLLQDIKKFPRHNDDKVDTLNAMQDIKLKYAKFCSLAKINLLYSETKSLDF
ncbi:uncharacterized protein [Prorops nasuta]|uniref:uncharacterized protein n=1 Tax=Prorops nasuta TaxID=863751 RepID=UPI0034D00DB0